VIARMAECVVHINPIQAAVQQLHLLLTSLHTLHFNIKWLAPCSHLFPYQMLS